MLRILDFFLQFWNHRSKIVADRDFGDRHARLLVFSKVAWSDNRLRVHVVESLGQIASRRTESFCQLMNLTFVRDSVLVLAKLGIVVHETS